MISQMTRIADPICIRASLAAFPGISGEAYP
jgi:hypothetical protein